MVTSSRAFSFPSAVRSERGRAGVFRAITHVAACVLLAACLASCKNVLNDGNDAEAFHMRLVNLLEDSPSVQYSIDSTTVASIAYLGATAFNSAHPGDHTVNFAVIRPTSLNSDDTTDPIPIAGSFSQSYTRDRDYTVFAYGTIATPKTLVLDEQSNRASVEDDSIEYQFIDASPNLTAADIYITAPEGQINAPQKVGTLAFGEKTTPATLKLLRRADVTDTDAALVVDFTIELRDPTTGDVLFNSGKQTLSEKTRLIWAIVNNVGPGPSKVQLLGLGDNTTPIVSTTDGGAVRAVHVSADTPAIDVFRDSTLTVPVASNLAFRDVSSYVNVPKGDVDLVAMPASSASVAILFVEEFSAANNTSYSAYVAGPLATVDALVIQDDRRSVPTQSKFRFLNVAPSQSGEDALSIYLTLPGQALDFTESTSTTDDDASKFSRGSISWLGAPTDYATLKSGTYQVRMTPTGTSRVVLDTTITVQDGSVQTYALLDDPETASLELIPIEEALLE